MWFVLRDCRNESVVQEPDDFVVCGPWGEALHPTRASAEKALRRYRAEFPAETYLLAQVQAEQPHP